MGSDGITHQGDTETRRTGREGEPQMRGRSGATGAGPRADGRRCSGGWQKTLILFLCPSVPRPGAYSLSTRFRAKRRDWGSGLPRRARRTRSGGRAGRGEGHPPKPNDPHFQRPTCSPAASCSLCPMCPSWICRFRRFAPFRSSVGRSLCTAYRLKNREARAPSTPPTEGWASKPAMSGDWPAAWESASGWFSCRNPMICDR
jgi:hypothetical protein